jgi:hypothetical protein
MIPSLPNPPLPALTAADFEFLYDYDNRVHLLEDDYGRLYGFSHEVQPFIDEYHRYYELVNEEPIPERDRLTRYDVGLAYAVRLPGDDEDCALFWYGEAVTSDTPGAAPIMFIAP